MLAASAASPVLARPGFRSSRLAVALYVLLAVLGYWLVLSLLVHLAGDGSPPNPRDRFGSEQELQQYFYQHRSEIPAFNQADNEYRVWQMEHRGGAFPALGPHGTTVVVLTDVFGLGGVVILGLLVAGVVGRTATRALLLGGFALSVVLGRILIGWIMPYLGMALVVLPEPWAAFGSVLLPVAALWLGGLLATVLIGGLVGAVFGVCVGMPMAVFNQIMQFEIAAQIFRHKRNGLIGYLVRLSHWFAGEDVTYAPDDSKGARFATAAEVEPLRDGNGDPYGYVAARQLLMTTPKHVCVMASTRSGKGVTLLLTRLLGYRGSAFVLDPKGENAAVTYRRRAQLNDKVLCLDPFGISGQPQARYNPMRRLTDENRDAESKALAEALIPEEDQKQNHWVISARQVLALLIYFVSASPSFTPDEKDLLTVRRLLLGPMNLTLAAIAKDHSLGFGLKAAEAASFLATPETELGGILSTARRNTAILDTPQLAACLAGAGDSEEIDFAFWREGTMTVFLCLAAPMFPVFNRWLRLVLTSALNELTTRLDPPPLPVQFILDELATLGHLQTVENAVGLAAGYGVQLVTVWQDLAQLKALYKERWASFINNSGICAVLALGETESAEYWSKSLGSRLEATYSAQVDIFGLSKGGTQGETMRPLVSSDEFMRQFAADKNRMLVLCEGQRPILAGRIPYYRDPTYAGLWDPPPGHPRAAPVEPPVSAVDAVSDPQLAA